MASKVKEAAGVAGASAAVVAAGSPFEVEVRTKLLEAEARADAMLELLRMILRLVTRVTGPPLRSE